MKTKSEPHKYIDDSVIILRIRLECFVFTLNISLYNCDLKIKSIINIIAIHSETIEEIKTTTHGLIFRSHTYKRKMPNNIFDIIETTDIYPSPFILPNPIKIQLKEREI